MVTQDSKEFNEDKLGTAVKYATLTRIGMYIVVGIVAMAGGFWADKYQIQGNNEKILTNTAQIAVLRSEMRDQNEKNSSILQQILIKVTRLETKTDYFIKK